jgi:hypothetical protein
MNEVVEETIPTLRRNYKKCPWVNKEEYTQR